MKLVIQRVLEANVKVEGELVGEIEEGLLVFLGIHIQDGPEKISHLVDKLIHLRIFADEEGKMNKSLLDIKGGVLLVSQFTLYADCKTGRRPSFLESAKSEKALALYEAFSSELEKALKVTSCPFATGVFGADMKIALINSGPVTLILEH